ncbi:MAG TPA: hypothetical protein VHF22_12200, partial [Planctomycetota bacterium]|nr:hypothetical protein [Planctomycetota bacterium]
ALRLRFRLPDRRAQIRGADPAAAQPIAHLAPVRREAFDSPWLLGQVPIEAAKDGMELYRQWQLSK